MWGLHGSRNGTAASVDVFLKEPSVIGAKKLLDDANVSYDVVIEDLQKAIETENPPKEEIEQLQNRKGEFLFLILFLNCFFFVRKSKRMFITKRLGYQ